MHFRPIFSRIQKDRGTLTTAMLVWFAKLMRINHVKFCRELLCLRLIASCFVLCLCRAVVLLFCHVLMLKVVFLKVVQTFWLPNINQCCISALPCHYVCCYVSWKKLHWILRGNCASKNWLKQLSLTYAFITSIFEASVLRYLTASCISMALSFRICTGKFAETICNGLANSRFQFNSQFNSISICFHHTHSCIVAPQTWQVPV